jgi:hypothetical protein
MNGKIFDLTVFLIVNQRGLEIIEKLGGRDGTQKFH